MLRRCSKRLIVTVLVFTLTFAAAAHAWSQGSNYPERPIRIVVTFGPGGGVDVMGPH
jgi:tripartite-type tricarboxylate transporter receptor subunit TctC